jgi:hypothetical protein
MAVENLRERSHKIFYVTVWKIIEQSQTVFQMFRPELFEMLSVVEQFFLVIYDKMFTNSLLCWIKKGYL